MSTKRHRLSIGLATAMVISWLAACGSSGDATGRTATGATEATSGAAAGGPVNLTFWSAAPGEAAAAAAFNASHPGIHVTVQTIPSASSTGYTKLSAALKAGNGPDLAQIPYDLLPNAVSNKWAADISKVLPDSAKSQFAPGAWSQVSINGGVYGVPLDQGPMGLLYRKDVFDAYGLKAPATWAEYALDAATIHAKDPSVHIGNFDPSDANWLAGMAWQNGAKWFGISGQSWQVGINDAATKEVLSYWQDLVNKGFVTTETDFSPSLAKYWQTGKVLSWPTAVWGTATLASSVPGLRGKWAVAALPQWRQGQSASGSWGGSSTAVTSNSKHPKEAAEFALWQSTQAAPLGTLIAKAGIYPASTAGTALPAANEPLSYYGNANVFKVFAAAAGGVSPGWAWGPTMADTYAVLAQAITSSTANRTPGASALDSVQSKVVSDMKARGISVK